MKGRPQRSEPVAQVFRDARVGMYPQEHGPFIAPPIVDIARGLLEMQKAGLIRDLRIDAGYIRIALGSSRRSISISEAAKVVQAFRKGIA